VEEVDPRAAAATVAGDESLRGVVSRVQIRLAERNPGGDDAQPGAMVGQQPRFSDLARSYSSARATIDGNFCCACNGSDRAWPRQRPLTVVGLD
jgi:hypothetical protein